MMKDETFFRKVDPNCFSPEQRIKEMDQTGIVAMFSYLAEPFGIISIPYFVLLIFRIIA